MLGKNSVCRVSPLLVIRFHCVGVQVSTGLPCINKGVQLKSSMLYLTTYMPSFDWCRIQLMLDVLERC